MQIVSPMRTGEWVPDMLWEFLANVERMRVCLAVRDLTSAPRVYLHHVRKVPF